ncbi:hypothetical protein Tco_0265414 [Tanacetum coccineum]
MSSNTLDYIYPIIVRIDSNVRDDIFPLQLLLDSHLLTASPDYPSLHRESPSDPSISFFPRVIFPPHKRARFLSSSSSDSSAPPQVFEIGESSHKTHLERHEEQIETILKHLGVRLPLERIEPYGRYDRWFGNGRGFPQRRDFDQLETELQEACTQIFGFQKEEMRHDNEIVLARVRTSTLEILINGPMRTPTSAATLSHVSGFCVPIRKLVVDCVAAGSGSKAEMISRLTLEDSRNWQFYVRNYVPISEITYGSLHQGDYPGVLKEMSPLQSLKLWRKHAINPEVNGSGNKAQLCARNQ